MFQILIGRETSKLVELVLRLGAQTHNVSPFARMRSLAIADKFGDISDNSQSKLFPEIIGEPADAGGARDVLRPVRWNVDYAGVPCVWVLTVTDESGAIKKTDRAGSIWDLFNQTVGILPVGFLEWAAASQPGDKIMSFDNKAGLYYQLEVEPG
jgi:hypothetical protein